MTVLINVEYVPNRPPVSPHQHQAQKAQIVTRYPTYPGFLLKVIIFYSATHLFMMQRKFTLLNGSRPKIENLQVSMPTHIPALKKAAHAATRIL